MLVSALLMPALLAAAPKPPEFSKTVQPYLKVTTPKVVITHVKVIDGTGGPAQDDRTVVITGGKITAIQPGADVAASEGATVIDGKGHSLLPGIVGMHNHLFYVDVPNLTIDFKLEFPIGLPQMAFSAPRLYLANGVTTMRTTGSVDPYGDLNLRRQIDDGQLPGPHLDVTAPYLQGDNRFFLSMASLKNADDARQTVEFWAARGATSFKAYTHITRAELKAAIDAAHKLGLKVTGHLCSVTFPEAAELGIDDLEHGFFVNTQNDPDKKPDQCSKSEGNDTLMKMDPAGADAKKLFETLIKHHVAITSTLPVFEADNSAKRAPLDKRALEAMSPDTREAVLYHRLLTPEAKGDPTPMEREMAMERAFVAAGGLLLSGPDPTGAGDVVPGFGDQRGIELLVDAGFTPVEAIKIATLNGAVYLGRDKQIGSIAVGKNADLIFVKGDPSSKIAEIENVEIVFKDGVGFDSPKLISSVKGRYGLY